jgi:hypothetical protein
VWGVAMMLGGVRFPRHSHSIIRWNDGMTSIGGEYPQRPPRKECLFIAVIVTL